MAKFNINKIKGVDTNVNDKKTSENVVDGLLNSASQNLQSDMKKSEFVKYEEIVPNVKNRMSMDGIEELAQLIELGGLEQPLVVRQREDGKYVILTGHRRFAAIGLLRQKNKWNVDDLVEVKIKNLDNLDLPLNQEQKEMFEILVTNQNRTKTDADIAFEVKEWKAIIAELRNNNIDVIDIGYDENGQAIQQKIKGVKTQKLVAQRMGISPAQIAKVDKIENNGSEALKNALYENKISISTASDIAKDMPKETQEKIIGKVVKEKEPNEKITKSDILKESHKENHEELKNTDDNSFTDDTVITDKIFKSDINGIIKKLKKSQGVSMDQKKYATYLRKIDELSKLMD